MFTSRVHRDGAMQAEGPFHPAEFEACRNAEGQRMWIDVVTPALQPFYRDVQDHVIRTVELIDNIRELLGSAMETRLVQTSNRLNVVMKQLSGWAAIILIPTLIAGIYGMSFEHMPELDWRLGYPLALSMMAVAAFLSCTGRSAAVAGSEGSTCAGR